MRPEDLIRQIEALPRLLREDILQKAVDKNIKIFDEQIKEHLSAPPGHSENIHARTGTWRASMASWTEKEGDDIVALFGLNKKLPYPPANEFGATIPPRWIVARHKKALAWPIGSAIFGSGKRAGQINPKGKAPMAFAKYVDWPGAVIPARRPYGRAIEAPTLQEKFIDWTAADVAKKIEVVLGRK